MRATRRLEAKLLLLATFLASVGTPTTTVRAQEGSAVGADGIPRLVGKDGREQVVHPPGAVVDAVVVAVESPVTRPSAGAQTRPAEAGRSGKLYSIATLEVVEVLAGSPPEQIELHWSSYMRVSEDGVPYHSRSISESAQVGPLLPGMRVRGYFGPNTAEWWGGQTDQRDGLWVTRGQVYFEDDSGVLYRSFKIHDIDQVVVDLFSLSRRAKRTDLLERVTYLDEAASPKTESREYVQAFHRDLVTWEAYNAMQER